MNAAAEIRLPGSVRAVVGGSLAIGVALVIAKVIVGLLTGSLGILSEAAHSGLDLAASVFAVIAVRTARKPADPDHPFGHGRAENLAAFTEGVLLLLTALGIGIEGARRLLEGTGHVNPAWYALALLAAAMVIEGGRALGLRWAARRARSEALGADAGNRVADVASSLGVLAGLIGVRAGFPWADSVAALAVSGLIAWAAIAILRRSGDVLMDRAPDGASESLSRIIAAVHGVREVRGVRVRRSGARLLGDARVSARRTLSVEAAGNLAEAVRKAVAEAMPDLELVLSVEAQPSDKTALVERVHAAAVHVRGIHDLHNVTAEREEDGSLHVTMHVKLPSHLSLAEAATVSRVLEDRVREELGSVSRVDIHLEPLEADIVAGSDVTERHAEMVDGIRAVVAADTMIRCLREVELSSRDGAITAHVVLEMDPTTSLADVHVVETRLAAALRREVAGLAEVVTRTTT